jgi:hypothetical protein
MKPRRVWTYFAAGALILTTLALQGCFESVPADPAYGYGYPAYGYNPPVIYPGRPVYGTPAPSVYGDYDDYHRWHDRDWWVNNRRPWVEQHHPDWVTARPAPHQAYDHHDRHDRD